MKEERGGCLGEGVTRMKRRRRTVIGEVGVGSGEGVIATESTGVRKGSERE